MKRMRILGLALVAVFALGALAASGASATPAWIECAKLTKVEGKYTGKYTDKLCTTEASEAEKTEGKHNKYELQPGIGKGKAFKTKGGEAILQVVIPPTGKGPFGKGGELQVKCTSFKGSGKAALPNLVNSVKDEFKGCTVLGTAPCQSGTKKGVIVTNALAGEMVDIEGFPTPVGTLLHAEAGEGPLTPSATFECTGVGSSVVFGSLIGLHGGNVGTINKESTDTFVTGAGLGEVEWDPKGHPGSLYTPIVNVPTHVSGGFNGEHFLVTQVTEAGEKEPAGNLPSGQKGVATNKGEAIMVTP